MHFDINNTILMRDSTKGLNTASNVSRIVAKSVWGRHTQSDAGHHWELCHDQLTFVEPESPNLLANLAEANGNTSICSYMDYVDAHFPKLSGSESQEEKDEREELRTSMVAKFSQPGGLGSKFKNQAEKMMKQLALPKGAKDELGIVGDNGMEPDADATRETEAEGAHSDEDEDVKREREFKAFEKRMTRELYGEGRYHLIPSFFRTLMYLKKNKQEFSVVFRTFGPDRDAVAYEFDKFAKGEHPCFNGRNGLPLVKMDGAKATKDFRFKNDDTQYATMYRLGNDMAETAMVVGKDHTRCANEDINHAREEFTVLNSPHEIYSEILETLKKDSVMAIQDDFPSWKESGYENERAKLMMIDQADYNTQHIFFDDNADSPESCIVDVRDVVTGEQLPYKKFMDMYVVKVHPHRAILESDYFVKCIEQCELRRDEEIRRMEAGIAEEEYEIVRKNKDTETEWEKLQKLPDADYLMKTVLPVLYMGMRVVDLERPNAPLEYLAMYLLKNQDKISLPPKVLSK